MAYGPDSSQVGMANGPDSSQVGMANLRFGMTVTLTIIDHIDHLIIVIIIPFIIITAIGMTRIGLSSIFRFYFDQIGYHILP